MLMPLRPGYVRGLGSGPKPTPKPPKVLVQQKKQAEDRAKAAEEKNEELMRLNMASKMRLPHVGEGFLMDATT
ncbi:hypothetical protein FNV43_RR02095 [Rhamnella rubrinervis]|uniref:Uncharacterized protein n=1 Tax=Rhamnella rubrinervis TaxID=2594499 RepID=A0A8K0HR19_9ROSA|nr:hypothetical protein FNV43_RR02095 [Rhamnella rubrinervis]